MDSLSTCTCQALVYTPYGDFLISSPLSPQMRKLTLQGQLTRPRPDVTPWESYGACAARVPDSALSSRLCFEDGTEDAPATCQGPLQARAPPKEPGSGTGREAGCGGACTRAHGVQRQREPSQGRTLGIVCVKVTLLGSAERQRWTARRPCSEARLKGKARCGFQSLSVQVAGQRGIRWELARRSPRGSQAR